MVVDASMALAWCFDGEATAATDAVLAQVRRDGGVVPPLWRYEVGNALLTAWRRDRLTEADVRRLLALLRSLPIDVDADVPDGVELVMSGHDHGLTAYDAAYLVLAQRRGLALATLDDVLGEAAARAGVSVLPERAHPGSA